MSVTQLFFTHLQLEAAGGECEEHSAGVQDLTESYFNSLCFH